MKVEKISVAVTAEMAAMLRAAVESGDYASSSEVVRDALRLWKGREEAMARRTEELRRLWQEGLDSGPSVDGAEAFARLRRRVAAAESGSDELERAVALAEAEIEGNEVVKHERVRAWLLDLAQGLDRPAPESAERP